MGTLDKRERAGAGLAAGSVLLVGGSVAASSLLAGYPVLGGQAVRYLAAGILLAAWTRLQRKPLPRPAGREWAWLAALAAIGLAGCSVLMIQATRVADPASVGVIIGAAPLVIIIAAAITARRRPTSQVLLAAAVVTAGSAAAQLGGATGPTWSPAGLLWSAGALGGVVGSSLLAAPLLPRLGAMAVTVYACGLAGILLLAAATVVHVAGGPPILRTPTAAQLASLVYLTIAVTALVFIAWYGAMERLGMDRTGLFNGLIPVTSLAAVTLTGTGTITPLRLLGAVAVLAGVLLGLSRARQVPVGTVIQAVSTPEPTTTLKVVPGGAPGPKGGGRPRLYLPLGRARSSPYFATVVGSSNRGLVIVVVIVPLDRSWPSVTRMTVFAVFSTTQRLDPWSSSPSMEFGMRPATLTGALAPVTGFTVNSLSSTVLSTIRVLPSAVAAMPFRLRPAVEKAATGPLRGIVTARPRRPNGPIGISYMSGL
jgi:drug/metabolite transporter (DMT)-like permease